MVRLNAAIVRKLLLAPAVLALLIVPLLVLGQAHAATKTWDGGCGVDTTWSCANNWSDNIVPGSADIVNFSSSFTGNSTVDASFAGTITIINMNAGYTGTITLNRSLTVTNTFSQAAGTFTAGSQTLTTVILSLSAGSFTASSGTTNVSGAFTVTGSPTFNANGGTVNFNKSTGTTTNLNCGNVAFNFVTITNTVGTEIVNSDCSLPLGNNPTIGVGSGAVSVSGTLSGTGSITTSNAMTLGSGGSLSGFSGLTVGSSLTVNGIYNFASYSPLSIGTGLTMNSGGTLTAPSGTTSVGTTFTLNSGATFNANGGTLSVGSTFTISSGSTFNASSGTVNFNAGSAIIACNNTVFNLVTFTHAGGTKTVGSDCNLPVGNNPALGSGTGALTLNGTLSGTGTIAAAGVFTLGNSSVLSGFSGLTTGSNLTVNGSYSFGSYAPFSVGGNFSLGATGSFTAPSGTASFSGSFTVTAGATFNANGGTVNFTGGTSTLSCNNVTFNLVTFTNNSSSKVVNSDCSLPLGNNPTVSAAGGGITLNGTLSGSGTLAKSSGQFTLNSGSALVGFSGLTAGSSLTVGGTYNVGSYSPFTVNAAFTLNSGAVFTAPSGTASFGSTFTLSSGSTFNSNGGTVNFNTFNGSFGTLTCNNTVFNLVTFTNTVTKTVGSDCSLPLGNNPTIGSLVGGGNAGLTLNGTLTGTGTIHKVGGVFTFNSGATLSGFTGLLSDGSTTINSGANANFSNYTTFSIGTQFILNSGAVFTAPAGLAIFRDNMTVNAGATFNANGGTAQIVTDTSSSPAGTSTITGDFTFYNLIVTTEDTNTLVFTAGSTQTVQGKLTVDGTSSTAINLVSSTAGSPWFITVQGSTNVEYVNVSDSHVLGDAIVACNSTDSGGNVGWVFNPDACNPTHGSDAATAVNNYEALQASLVSQSDQDQSQPPTAAASSNNLASKLNDFVKQFPGGKGLVKAALQFLQVMLGLVIFGLLFVAFLFLLGWRRRKQEQDAIDTVPAIITPTVITPSAIPGSTVTPRPLVPKDSIPFKLPDNPHSRLR